MNKEKSRLNLLYFDISNLPEGVEKKVKISVNQRIKCGYFADVAIWCMNQFYSSRSPIMASMACFYLIKSGKSFVFENFIRFILDFDPSIIKSFPEAVKRHVGKVVIEPGVDLTESRYIRQGSHKDRRWPREISLKLDHQLIQVFDSLYNRFNRDKSIINRNDPKFVSIGSCFAVNISRSLKRQGYECFNVQIDERRNSTDKISGIFDDVMNNESINVQANFSDSDLLILRSKIKKSSHIIVTLGVSLVFKEKGKIVDHQNIKDILSGNLHPYIISVKENINYIDRIVKSIDASKSQLIFSVSPVPLTWANCGIGDLIYYDIQSKMSLLEAVHYVCSENNLIYWPSFEFIKWFGAHSSDPFFGSDHPDSRHVRDEIVDLVTGAFTSKISTNLK